MYAINVRYTNNGETRSTTETLENAVAYAFSYFCDTDYLGRYEIKSIEIRKKVGNRWILLAL